MAFDDDDPSGRLAARRARADVVISRLAACVFGVSGASAAWFGHWILAAGLATAGVILFCISLFASAKFRRLRFGRRHYTVVEQPQTESATQKGKRSWLAWIGILLVALGIAWAAMFFAHASRAAWKSTPDKLLGIACLVQALVGVMVITHTRRTPPV